MLTCKCNTSLHENRKGYQFPNCQATTWSIRSLANPLSFLMLFVMCCFVVCVQGQLAQTTATSSSWEVENYTWMQLHDNSRPLQNSLEHAYFQYLQHTLSSLTCVNLEDVQQPSEDVGNMWARSSVLSIQFQFCHAIDSKPAMESNEFARKTSASLHDNCSPQCKCLQKKPTSNSRLWIFSITTLLSQKMITTAAKYSSIRQCSFAMGTAFDLNKIIYSRCNSKSRSNADLCQA